MEKLPSDTLSWNSYADKLREQKCIERVEEGLNLKIESYPLAAIPEGLEFEVEILRDSAVGFLNASLVVDTFSSHDERISWYNESGVLADGGAKFYMANKLRLNILGGFLRTSVTCAEYFAKCYRNGRIPIDTKLSPLTDGMRDAKSNYAELAIEEKLALVAQAQKIAKEALNELIEWGWIEGERVV